MGNKGKKRDNGIEVPADGEDNVLPFAPNSGKSRPAARQNGGSRPDKEEPEWEDARDPEVVQSILHRIGRYSSHGLTREEILDLMKNEMMEEGISGEEFESAMEQGNAMGRANIKQAQYKAAIHGKVNAQAKVLSLLGAGEGPESEHRGENQKFEVIREIITAGSEHN